METLAKIRINLKIKMILVSFLIIFVTAGTNLIISSACGGNLAVSKTVPAIIISLAALGIILEVSSFSDILLGLLVMSIAFFFFPISALLLLIFIPSFFSQGWTLPLLKVTASLMASSAFLSLFSSRVQALRKFSLGLFGIITIICLSVLA